VCIDSIYQNTLYVDLFDSPIEGISTFSMASNRKFPEGKPDDRTHEYIHESVLDHPACPPKIKETVEKYPEIVCKLSAYEAQVKDKWSYDKSSPMAVEYEARLSKTQNESWAPINTFNSLKMRFWPGNV
jgi:hypothetical protein